MEYFHLKWIEYIKFRHWSVRIRFDHCPEGATFSKRSLGKCIDPYMPSTSISIFSNSVSTRFNFMTASSPNDFTTSVRSVST